MSLNAALTITSQFAVSAHCQSTGDALDPTMAAATVLADGSDATYLAATDHGGTVDTYSATCEFTDMPDASSVESVTVEWRDQAGNPPFGVSLPEINYSRVYFDLAGTLYYSPDFVCLPAITQRSHTFLFNPGTLAAWTQAGVNSARIGVEGRSEGWVGFATMPLIMKLNAYATYTAAPIEIDQARDTATRRVWLRRRPGGRITLTGPPSLWDFVPGSRIELEHLAGYHVTGNGWEDLPEERRPIWVEYPEWDPETWTVTLHCLDHRPKLCTLYDSGFANVAGVLRDGLMRQSVGSTFFMSRSTSSELLDATGQLASVPPDVEAYSDRGQIIQRSVTNYMLNTAWALGVDVDWASGGEGSNGSDVTEDLNQVLWTRDLSTRSLKFQGGNPVHAANLYTAQNFPSVRGLKCFSIYHQDAGGVLYVAIQRSIDSKFWRASDSTWQVAAQWGALTQRADWARDHIQNVDLGGSDTNVSVYIGLPTSMTLVAGQSHLVAHVQFTDGGYPSAPILTRDLAMTRGEDLPSISNNLAARCINAECFTLMLQCEAFWSASQLTALAVRTILYAEHDANNFIQVTYSKATGRIQAVIKRAGVAYTASISYGPAQFSRFMLTIQQASSRGEYGLAPYALQVFVGGNPGDTSAALPGPIVEAATSRVYIGNTTGGGSAFDGYIREHFFSPQVLSVNEITRGI